MKRWMRLAATLYPRVWRERYGEEFDALLEDYNPNWREFTNTLGGALMMQIKLGTAIWKAAAVTAVAGAVVAAAVAYHSRLYTSTAVAAVPKAEVQLSEAVASSRGNLSAIITDRSLNLYPDLRKRHALEDAIGAMVRDLRFTVSDLRASGEYSRALVTVSFAYPDKALAEAVAARLTDRIVSEANWNQIHREKVRRVTWPDAPTPPPSVRAAVQSRAAAGSAAVPGRVYWYIPLGLGCGAVAGVFCLFLLRSPKAALGYALLFACGAVLVIVAAQLRSMIQSDAGSQSRLWYAGLGIGGVTLAGGAALWRFGRPLPALRYLVFAVCGAILFTLAAYGVPDRFTSTAVLVLEPPMFPERPSAEAFASTMTGRFQQARQKALSTDTLRQIIRKRRLYPVETARLPIDEVVNLMRRNIAIRSIARQFTPTGGDPTIAIGSISFSYPDKYKAQAATTHLVSEVATGYVSGSLALADQAGRGSEVAFLAERGLGGRLLLLDPASLPQSPDSPNRLLIAGLGAAAGLLVRVAGQRLNRLRSRRGPELQPSAA